MRILDAHVFNFGKLHDIDFKFDVGLNVFLRENGWGKTTLSAFIKSMFYGMEHTSSRDIEKNEKLKYFPWQDGVYGGKLSFSNNGKRYRISRTFSLRKNEDGFELIDLDTNKESSDFSSDLGVELFGVGRETYARSVYVTLDETPAGSSDISAKLNNLVEADDISNFAGAVSALDNAATAIKAKKGSSDELHSIQSKIDNDRFELEDIDARLRENMECQERIAAKKSFVAEIRHRQDAVAQQLSDCAKYERKVRYEQLKSDLSDAEKAKESAMSFFNGEAPTQEMIANMDSLHSMFNAAESNAKTQSVTQSQRSDYEQLTAYFDNGVPTSQQISDCIEADNEYRKFEQSESLLKPTPAEWDELDSLNSKYGNDSISSEIIADHIARFEEVQKKKSDLADRKSRLAQEESDYLMQKQRKFAIVKKIILMAIGAAALVAGIAGFVAGIWALGIAGAVSGIVLLAFGIVSRSENPELSALESLISNGKKEVAGLADEIANVEDQCKSFVAGYGFDSDSVLSSLSSISNEYEIYKRLRAKSDSFGAWLSNQPNPEGLLCKVRLFMSQYCKTDDISAVSAHMQVLNEKLKKIEQLEKLINSDSENGRTLTECKEKLNLILAGYRADKSKSLSQQVGEVHDMLTTLRNCDSRVDEARERLADFEENPDNGASDLENLARPEKNADELHALMRELSSEMNDANKTISDYEKTIDANLSYTDNKQDIEAEIESLEIAKSEKKAEYGILCKTMDFLKKAKENLDANYSAPMKESFGKYVKMLGSDLDLLIDTNLKVSLDCYGKLRDSASFSEGYKDMVNFCSRMALVDALFKDVTPPIILDDPFVNLDGEKLRNALELVKEISRKNQVIYFTCHESREIKQGR